VGEEDDSNLSDFIHDATADSPADLAARKLLNEAVLEALDELNDRERQVVRLRFGSRTARPARWRRSGGSSG
jgi:RNA polymerase primary sigma factor